MVRLHHLFLDGDESVLKTLSDYFLGNRRGAMTRIRDFIQTRRDRIRERLTPERRRTLRVRTGGKNFDLQDCFQRLNEEYFQGKLDCLVTWGYRRIGTKRSIRLGSYSDRTGVIRVNPVLDRPFVPFYVLDAVLYHEMIHHSLGAEEHHGRRVTHHKAFKETEKKFRHRHRADSWIKHNLSKLGEAERRITPHSRL